MQRNEGVAPPGMQGESGSARRGRGDVMVSRIEAGIGQSQNRAALYTLY